MTTERIKLLSPSDPYLQSSIGFAYRLREARVISLSRLLAPFEYHLWIVIVLIIVLSIIMILMTKKFPSKERHFFIGGRVNRSPVLNAWQSMLGKSIPNRFIANGQHFGNFCRTLTIFWILLWFSIRSLYEGALYTNLQTTHLTSSYDTIDKVRASNCKIITQGSTISFIEHLIKKDR